MNEDDILGPDDIASGGMPADNYDPSYDPDEDQRMLDEADRRARVRLAAQGKKLID
tara:strand:+ start:733 stop:900 length:168 start_codon:yes stop_codon:yes gene_type:complete